MTKIYRCAFVYNESNDATVRFSGWVRPEGMAEVKANVLTVNTPGEGGEPGTPPVILGWEEMQLEADEVGE